MAVVAVVAVAGVVSRSRPSGFAVVGMEPPFGNSRFQALRHTLISGGFVVAVTYCFESVNWALAESAPVLRNERTFERKRGTAFAAPRFQLGTSRIGSKISDRP
jgi:hypothetical protein